MRAAAYSSSVLGTMPMVVAAITHCAASEILDHLPARSELRTASELLPVAPCLDTCAHHLEVASASTVVMLSGWDGLEPSVRGRPNGTASHRRSVECVSRPSAVRLASGPCAKYVATFKHALDDWKTAAAITASAAFVGTYLSG
jgi:hypothetical protein